MELGARVVGGASELLVTVMHNGSDGPAIADNG